VHLTVTQWTHIDLKPICKSAFKHKVLFKTSEGGILVKKIYNYHFGKERRKMSFQSRAMCIILLQSYHIISALISSIVLRCSSMACICQRLILIVCW